MKASGRIAATILFAGATLVPPVGAAAPADTAPAASRRLAAGALVALCINLRGEESPKRSPDRGPAACPFMASAAQARGCFSRSAFRLLDGTLGTGE